MTVCISNCMLSGYFYLICYLLCIVLSFNLNLSLYMLYSTNNCYHS